MGAGGQSDYLRGQNWVSPQHPLKGFFMIKFDSEKSMEDFFFANYNRFSGDFDLFPSLNWKASRQVKLGSHGICDIIFTSVSETPEGFPELHIRLVELKNTELSHFHISQVSRYASFIKEAHEHFCGGVDFKAFLIGNKTFSESSSDLVYLCQSIDWLDVFECSIDPLSGVSINLVYGWHPSSHDESKVNDFFLFCGVDCDEGLKND